MSFKLTQELATLTSGQDQENDIERNLNMRKRKRMDGDVAGSPSKKIHGRSNITISTDPSSNVQEDVSVRKRKAGDDGKMPAKRMRCSNLTNTTDPSVMLVEDPSVVTKKRKASDAGGAPGKKMRCSERNSCSSDSIITVSSTPEDPSVILLEDPPLDMEVSDDGETPGERMTGSNSSSTSESSSGHSISLSISDASAEEERLYEMSSSANTSRADFEDKYHQSNPIGAGGFGSVYDGFRKSDYFPVAIKHIPIRSVIRERVACNGKVYNVILEVAFMLKTAGLPGSVGQSAAVSLLDWYILDQELILVMERPKRSMDLHRYLRARGGSLDEHEAKMILRQLVDAAIHMHSKGVFHRDIKLQNLLIQCESGVPRVRVIDFGCGSFATEKSFNYFCGTRDYFPPEWFDHQTYWACSTTVWQLGAVFYSLLSGHGHFKTKDFIANHIQINSTLSSDVRLLLDLCLNRDPVERVTLMELQYFFTNIECSP